MEACKNCAGNDIITDDRTADVICRGCGEVQGRVFDNGPEWFDEEQARASSPVNDFSARVFSESTGKIRDTHRLITEVCGNDSEIQRVSILLLERFESHIQNIATEAAVGALLCLAHKECGRNYSIGNIAKRLNTDMIKIGRVMRKFESILNPI